MLKGKNATATTKTKAKLCVFSNFFLKHHESNSTVQKSHVTQNTNPSTLKEQC